MRRLTRKAFAALHYLATHPGRVVTKEELFQAVWPAVVVSEAALTTCMREVRKVLADDPKVPQFIETVHRRGYRFIGAVRSPESTVRSQNTLTPSLQPLTPMLVGRERELEQLHNWLQKSLHGERQIVFASGEPGIGKTALVEAFLHQVAAEGSVWLGRGQCIEHYGAGEAYLPVLDALGRLGRAPDSHRLLAVLHQYAPTWLVQLPALLDATDLEALQRRTQGATRERMLRELAEAVEALTAEQPLVLWLEDLHWSDYSTLDWLAFVARRREAARVLVIGAYRPVDVIVREHPLKAVKQELQLHGYCEDLPLGLLSEAAVGEYLAVRFPSGIGAQLPLQRLAKLIHQRTDGNPLFMVNVVDYLVSHGMLIHVEGQWALQGGVEEVAAVVPESLQRMIERQTERLSSTERRVLAVASVAGAEFSAAAVAAGMGVEVGEVEEHCDELARREQFLRPAGISEWPDGTVAARYAFIHALNQNTVYERVTMGRRARLHQRIGEREEIAYGNRTGEIAAELAMHFERGRDYQRAAQYLRQAGENAVRRSAYVEAISLLTKGLGLLIALPETPEHAQQEIMLQITLGRALMATKGYAAPEVGKVYARVRALFPRVSETPQLFPALWGLQAFYKGVRGEYRAARELGEQLLRRAQSVQTPTLFLEAHHVLGQILYFLGELASAREHLEWGIALYDPQQHHSHGFLYGHDPGVACLGYAALVLWYLGYPDQALQRSYEALTLAQRLSHPYSLAYAPITAARLHQLRQEEQTTKERAEAAITLSAEQEFSFLIGVGTILLGWGLARQGHAEEGIVHIRQGLTALNAMGAELFTRAHFLALLAEVYGKVGQTEEGLDALAEALAVIDKTGERYYEAELYRLKGELTLQQSKQVKASQNKSRQVQGPESGVSNIQHPTPSTQAAAEAEACFLKAIDIARLQQAKSLELRAAMSLSRLWRQRGKAKKAHKLLAEVYGWFTEGFDTKDLQEANALLKELA